MTPIDGDRAIRTIRKIVDARIKNRTRVVHDRSISGSSSSEPSAGSDIPDEGGSQIIVSEIAPNAALYEEGDVWVQVDSGNVITSIYVHIAGAWTEFVIEPDDHLVLANSADEPESTDPADAIPGSLYRKISVAEGSLKKGLISGSAGETFLTLEWNRSAMLGFRHKQILSANPANSPYVTFPGISGVTVVSPATPVAADTADGAAVLFGTLGNQDSDCSLVADTGITALLWLDWLRSFGGMFGIKTNTLVRNWWGLFSGDPAGSDTPAVQMAGFRFSTSASDANWQAVASDGTNISVQDTGVAGTANQILFPMIEYDAVSGKLHYYIDGVHVAEIEGTYVPDLQVNLNFRVQARALGGLPVPNPPNPSFIRNILFGYCGFVLK